jgi:hypothetical protein
MAALPLETGRVLRFDVLTRSRRFCIVCDSNARSLRVVAPPSIRPLHARGSVPMLAKASIETRCVGVFKTLIFFEMFLRSGEEEECSSGL